MKKLHQIGVILGTGLLVSACAVDEAPTSATVAPILDGSGNWYALRAFGPAMAQVATDLSFSPFVSNALGSPDSLAKLTSGYEEITGIIGETTSGTNRTHVAKFAPRLFSKPSDGITNVSSSELQAILMGPTHNGNASTHTPPTSCGTTLGGVTVAMFIPDNIDAATEALRSKFGASDQDIYTWCQGTVRVFRNAMGQVQGQKLNASNAIVSVTLTPTCSSTDSPDVCVGKQAAVAGHVGVASINASNANNSRPTVDGTADTDANIRSAAFPLTLNLTLVQDTGQTQLNSFWTRIFGAGASAYETKLVGQGATVCDTVTPLHCS
jgi:hypothetical protein